jgi:response regulator RpfG family c-di-GMP phosphodiesterase
VVCDEARACDDILMILSNDERLNVHHVSVDQNVMQIASESETDIVIFPAKAMGAYQVHPCNKTKENNDYLLSPLLLLLSDGMDAGQIAECLEQGADDYIERDVCGEILLPKIRSLLCKRRLRQNLWKEENRLAEVNILLQKNFKELTSILLRILEVRVPGASDRSEMAKAFADFCGQRLGFHEERKKQIIFAALLHEIGKIGLPDEVVSKHQCTIGASFITVFQQYVTVGSMVISTITGYREAAEAVHHQLENYDGSGFPGELMGEEIPIGARILRAIVFQEELEAQGYPIDSIIDHVRSSMHSALDQNIANLLIEFLSNRSQKVGPKEIKLPVDELTAGMIIAKDVYAASGIKLMPKGIQLMEKTLALLHERNETDPIIGGVYVLADTYSNK